MNNINKLAEALGELFGYIRNIFLGKTEIFKLTVLEKGTKIGGIAVYSLIVVFMSFLIIQFLLFALSAYLYTVVGSLTLAFLIVSGILLLLTVLFYLLRTTLFMNPIFNAILRTINSNDDDEN